MTRLTIQINDAVAEKAHQLAADRQTTVDSLVEALIEQCEPAGSRGGDTRRLLEESFRQVSSALGGKPWSNREELHDR